jgi:glycosyltransferase involved in cell wall biosynthesis
MAAGLAEAGDEVHVWTGGEAEVDRASGSSPSVHYVAGSFSPRDLRRLGRRLDGHPAPRQLFVQWVPQSYGYRSLNLPFCLWLLARARRGDRVEVMVHEPWLSFRRGHLRWNAVAAVHRLMTIVLLGAATRVWVSAPLWAELWRRYDLRADTPFGWLPLPNGIPVVPDAAGAAAFRARATSGRSGTIGYFGLAPPGVDELLAAWIPPVLALDAGRGFLLIGQGSQECRRVILERHPQLELRIHATGPLTLVEISAALQACDLVVQPFVGGVNARRSSVLAALGHGLPVVTTCGPFTEPFWEASRGVALIDEADVTTAWIVIDRLLRESDLRDRLAVQGARLYDERFDIRHAISTLRKSEQWTGTEGDPML